MPSVTSSDFSNLPDSAATTHKRTPSGGLFSKLPFLRAASEPTHGDDDSISPTSSTSSTSPAGSEHKSAVPSSLSRKPTNRARKGSLRKTALLGTGSQRFWREHSPLETITSPRLSRDYDPLGQPSAEDEDPTPRVSEDRKHLHGSGSSSNGTNTSKKSMSNGHKSSSPTTSSSAKRAAQTSTSSEDGVATAGLAMRGGTATLRSDVSTTTDEDDASLDGAPQKPIGSSAAQRLPEDPASYFALPKALVNAGSNGILRRGKPTAKSPLAQLPAEPSPVPEEWDYADTEWWGWIILIVTWAVFVVGMGSCFEVWSWAWDVGETPYAPPELEDDATLPIVGYYPALMILSGVMAWVWVITAWVGMKYFKHAKISGEDV